MRDPGRLRARTPLGRVAAGAGPVRAVCPVRASPAGAGSPRPDPAAEPRGRLPRCRSSEPSWWLFDLSVISTVTGHRSQDNEVTHAPFTGISLNLTLRGDILLETPPRVASGPLAQPGRAAKAVPFYLRIILVNPCQGQWSLGLPMSGFDRDSCVHPVTGETNVTKRRCGFASSLAVTSGWGRRRSAAQESPRNYYVIPYRRMACAAWPGPGTAPVSGAAGIGRARDRARPGRGGRGR